MGGEGGGGEEKTPNFVLLVALQPCRARAGHTRRWNSCDVIYALSAEKAA